MSSINDLRISIHRVIICSVLILMMGTLCGCVTIGFPTSKAQAEKNVSNAFGHEMKALEHKVQRSEERKLHKDHFYEFEDKNGMRFTYASKVTGHGFLDATLYYSYVDFCNYDRRIPCFYADKIKAICDEHGLTYDSDALGFKSGPNVGPDYDIFENPNQYGGPGVYIYGVDDIDAAAEVIYNVLDVCRVEKVDTYKFNNEYADSVMTVVVPNEDGKHFIPVGKFSFITDNEEVPDTQEIRTKIYKEYIEGVKAGNINNDLSDDVLESVNPDIIRGRYNGEFYQQWVGTLVDETDAENPVYSFTLRYREPHDKENYQYVDCYNTRNLSVYNVLAQLGGDVFYHLKSDGEPEGYNVYLGEDMYYIYFSDKDETVVTIDKNDKSYSFETELFNPVTNERIFKVSKDEMEEIFGISITYDNANSEFLVEKK